MGQAASSGTKKLPTANDVRALLFGGRVATLTTPPNGLTSDLIFEGTVQQLQGELAAKEAEASDVFFILKGRGTRGEIWGWG